MESENQKSLETFVQTIELHFECKKNKCRRFKTEGGIFNLNSGSKSRFLYKSTTLLLASFY